MAFWPLKCLFTEKFSVTQMRMKCLIAAWTADKSSWANRSWILSLRNASFLQIQMIDVLRFFICLWFILVVIQLKCFEKISRFPWFCKFIFNFSLFLVENFQTKLDFLSKGIRLFHKHKPGLLLPKSVNLKTVESADFHFLSCFHANWNDAFYTVQVSGSHCISLRNW